MTTYEKDYSEQDLDVLCQLSENDLYEQIGKFLVPPTKEQPNLRKIPAKILAIVLLVVIIIAISSLIIGGFIFVPQFTLWALATVFIALVISAIGASLLLPACNVSREKARKVNRICKGKEFFYEHIPEIQKLLCEKGEPRFVVQEITSGEIRNIISVIMLSNTSIPTAIVSYIAILILKLGLNKFCAIDFYDKY